MKPASATNTMHHASNLIAMLATSLLLMCVLHSLAASSVQSPPDGFSRETNGQHGAILGREKRNTESDMDCLEANNFFRNLHEVPELAWDVNLANRALKHSKEMAAKNSIFVIPAQENKMLVGAYPNQKRNCIDIVDKWYKEGSHNYDYNSPVSTVAGAASFVKMIWRGSTHMGCGSADSTQGPLLTCIYSPGANFKDSAANYDKQIARPKGVIEESGGGGGSSSSSSTKAPEDRMLADSEEPPSASESQTSVSVDEDNIWEKIQATSERFGKGSDASDRREFIRALMETMKGAKPAGFSAIIINMDNNYQEDLVAVRMHGTITKYGHRFGLWIFKCGAFMNSGPKGDEDFAQAGAYKSYRSNAGFIFRHLECPTCSYKPFNHFVLAKRSWDLGADIGRLDNVDMEECATWVMDLEGRAAAYERATRKCHAKRATKLLDGTLMDAKGGKLGAYNMAANVTQTTQSKSLMREWYKRNKCDVVHLSSDGMRSCKIFPKNDKFDLILIKETFNH